MSAGPTTLTVYSPSPFGFELIRQCHRIIRHPIASVPGPWMLRCAERRDRRGLLCAFTRPSDSELALMPDGDLSDIPWSPAR